MKREMFGPRFERSQRLIDQLELQLEELAAAAGEDETKAETSKARQQGLFYDIASYVQRLAGGAKPSDMLIEQSPRFYMAATLPQPMEIELAGAAVDQAGLQLHRLLHPRRQRSDPRWASAR